MLRITRQAEVLTLEGTLRDQWVNEVRDALSHVNGNTHDAGRCVWLDLSEVHYADAAGLALLRELLDRGVRIQSCSDYIAACLELGTP